MVETTETIRGAIYYGSVQECSSPFTSCQMARFSGTGTPTFSVPRSRHSRSRLPFVVWPRRLIACSHFSAAANATALVKGLLNDPPDQRAIARLSAAAHSELHHEDDVCSHAPRRRTRQQRVAADGQVLLRFRPTAFAG